MKDGLTKQEGQEGQKAPGWVLTIQGRTAALLTRTTAGWKATSPNGRTIASLCPSRQACVREVLQHSA